MSLVQLERISLGEVGIKPGSVKMISTANLATVTAAGYLNGISNSNNLVQLAPSDIVECLYNYNPVTDTGTLGIFQPSISKGVITLVATVSPGDVLLPVVSGNFAIFNGTTGQIKDAGFKPSDATKTVVSMVGAATLVNYMAKFVDITGTISSAPSAVTNAGDIYAGLSGTAGAVRSYPGTAANGYLALVGFNAGGAFNTIISNSAMLQTSTISIPDPGAATANFLLSALKSAGTQHITSGALQVDAGGLLSGLAAGGTAGSLTLFPATTGNGSFILAPVNAGGAFTTTVSNGVMGQSSVITIPDPGASTANFMLDAGTTTAKTITTLTSTTANITNLKYGATPVPQVDPASCTITAVAGATNTATITIQLKDGSGTNMARIIPFRVYSSSTSDGLTLQSAASTGYSVASGGLSLQNGAAITTQINVISSATGGCVLSLLDTGKQTSYLVLVLANGTKISAQLSSGSYG